jgi:DNA-damage-inducible protein D
MSQNFSFLFGKCIALNVTMRFIETAKEACHQSGNAIDNHFSQTGKMVKIGSSVKRAIEEYRPSCYAG